MIKNIIFDFGGVFVDWNPHYVYDPYFGDLEKSTWFLQNICTLAWNMELDENKSFQQGVQELSAKYPEWAKEIQMYDERWYDMISQTPIPGMYEYAKELKERGYKLYGLSNWNNDKFMLVRNVFPIFDLLDDMVISGREGVVKPKPEIYQLLLNRFGLKASECVFVDDNLTNVKAAREVGIHAIQFTKKEALVGPLEELLNQ